ncbi:MAG: hypothetical protein A3H96_26380 [Acidobacteria bacterium RIFCSPLOWO2_02_FULL_67_36]|nr:MAG: hypothetical protein A3H96_26380 [Acidobacteria bacterium RIFCSPLOWO2_02_FULL_67_36]OFW22029.1 MAG: hypothetical protein A3G21_13580 [Acidobacteria bacterium RIFCSPLOWO2_12_FULL_66_21]
MALLSQVAVSLEQRLSTLPRRRRIRHSSPSAQISTGSHHIALTGCVDQTIEASRFLQAHQDTAAKRTAVAESHAEPPITAG